MTSSSSSPWRLVLAAVALTVAAVALLRPDLVARLGTTTESVDPCESPLAWHIGNVDPRFGFSPQEIRDAVAEAAAVWESAAGRTLFRQDTAASMAIHLVYDDRQTRYQEQRAGQAELEALQEDIRALESLLVRLEQRLTRVRTAYERDPTPTSQDAYRTTLDRYNNTVDQFNRLVERHNRALETMRAAGSGDVRAGNLQWERQAINGRVISVDRELTIAVAGQRRELVLVLAHELGHALGLGHVPEPGALMAERFRQRDIRYPVQLQAADRQSLAERCGIDL